MTFWLKFSIRRIYCSWSLYIFNRYLVYSPRALHNRCFPPCWLYAISWIWFSFRSVNWRLIFSGLAIDYPSNTKMTIHLLFLSLCLEYGAIVPRIVKVITFIPRRLVLFFFENFIFVYLRIIDKLTLIAWRIDTNETNCI